MRMLDLMLEHFGPQYWWPGETAIEIIVGAVLTQNTSWKNVEKAIESLKKEGLLSLEALYHISQTELAEKIRPAGYYRIKAGRLKNLIVFMMKTYDGHIPDMLKESTDVLRAGLLSVKGVGPETADSILLYAAKRPVFVIDAYTHRILHRHSMIDEHQSDYYELQSLFMDNLPEDTRIYNELHALIVRTGKEYCRRKPLCGKCPLEDWS